MFCHEQVAQLRDEKDEIERRGAKLRVVGNGTPAMAKGFAEKHGLEGAVYTDPDRVTYRALGMARKLGATFSTKVLKGAARALKGGFRQERLQGDPWQQGGVLIVSGDGDLVYEYLSETAGDHPPVSELLDALTASSSAS